jgi:hypothetical protein
MVIYTAKCQPIAWLLLITEPHTNLKTIAACVSCASGSESATQGAITHLGPVALEQFPLE